MRKGGYGLRCAADAWPVTNFRRQHPIEGFIVDFACTKHRLVVEADGGQHAENPNDVRRTAIIEAQDWRVLRF